jgi:hypothetical protein
MLSISFSISSRCLTSNKFSGREPPRTPPDTPFGKLHGKCLKCGSYRLKVSSEFDEEAGELRVNLTCPRCHSCEVLRVGWSLTGTWDSKKCSNSSWGIQTPYYPFRVFPLTLSITWPQRHPSRDLIRSVLISLASEFSGQTW